MDSFAEGYAFFEKNCESYLGASQGEAYVRNVKEAIDNLREDLNAFEGFQTKSAALKGDIAEFWHSDTFNINAIIKGSKNRTYVDRSHEFASADVTSNFGKDFGLKYYKTGIDSAKQQAKSVFERFKEYQSQGGKDSLDEFLSKRGLDDIETILNDPIYSGQLRVIPKDQLEEATAWLKRKILEERSKRPEQVARYQETLNMLTDKIKDGKGAESVPLTKEEAEQLAGLAKEGKVTDKTLKELGISTEDLIKYENVMKQAFKAGISAATISMVLRVAPEVFKAISFLVNNGELDKNQFRRIGFEALRGGSEGFIRGSVSAAITTACKAGLWGETCKSVSPAVIGVVTVITMDTIKNAYNVSIGKMQTIELTNELVKEMFVSACSLAVGYALIEIPIFGFMLGSFLGSTIGAFAYNIGNSAILSFCIDSGFTMFGLVDQNYELPDEVMEEIGIDVFRFDEFIFDKFDIEKFEIDEFRIEKFELETLSIKILRRGVIGVNKIGYVIG